MYAASNTFKKNTKYHRIEKPNLLSVKLLAKKTNFGRLILEHFLILSHFGHISDKQFGHLAET